jgi:hypothetical protein
MLELLFVTSPEVRINDIPLDVSVEVSPQRVLGYAPQAAGY